MNKVYFVYIITNKKHSVLYTRVTNNLTKRIYGHKNKVVKGFSEKYNVIKLVYYEVFDSIETAIMREKQIKAGRRKKKLELINEFNKQWNDLYEGIEYSLIYEEKRDCHSS